MVADKVHTPVITGGGVGDARGVLAALALGADGIYMGTRFMVTRESESHPRVKEIIVKGQDACTISVPKLPGVAPISPIGIFPNIRLRSSGGRKSQSIAILKTPGIELLFSGVTINKPSAATIRFFPYTFS